MKTCISGKRKKLQEEEEEEEEVPSSRMGRCVTDVMICREQTVHVIPKINCSAELKEHADYEINLTSRDVEGGCVTSWQQQQPTNASQYFGLKDDRPHREN